MGYQGAPPRTLPGAGERPGLYLPDRLAVQAGLRPGDIVTLVSPRPGLTPLGPQPRLLSARLAGVYQQARGDDEPAAALPLERGQILFGTERVGSLHVATNDLDAALALAERLAPRLPAGAKVETWRELNRALFLALALERTGLFAAVSLIVAVAAIALFSDLQLVAASKQRELALLAAMGAGEPALRRAFLLLGLLLGGGGAVAGGILGGVAAVVLDRWQLVELPPGLLLFDSLPLRLRLEDVFLVVAVTLALTLACAALGSRRAARLLPAEVLRG
jgi:lipoprotein-releasing system permease protein